MNVLGTDPPFNELIFSNIFNKFLECPKTPRLGPVNSRRETIINNIPDNDITDVQDGIINDDPFQGPVNLLTGITLLPIHQTIIDDLFTRYRQGVLHPMLVKAIELQLHRDLTSYSAHERSLIRLQLAALHAASCIENILSFAKSRTNH